MTRARDAVLALSDLPAGCALTGERDDSWDAFSYRGYVSGWLAFYACPATSSRNMSILVEATTYTDPDGSREEVRQTGIFFSAGGPSSSSVELPVSETIGDALHVFVSTNTMFSADIEYDVVFSGANMSHLIMVRGPAAAVDLSMAMELAKRQLARVR